MDEIKQILFRFVLMLALVGGLFWFVKNSARVTIPQGDHSMSEATFPEGSYGINTSFEKMSDLKSGDAVAYFLPGDAANRHIARIVAMEGQRVALTPKGVTVDGEPYGYKIDLDKVGFPEFKVPRGCVYILADNPAIASDSFRFGPIPFIQILGTVKPLK